MFSRKTEKSEKCINKKEKPPFTPEKEYNVSTTKHKKEGFSYEDYTTDEPV